MKFFEWWHQTYNNLYLEWRKKWDWLVYILFNVVHEWMWVQIHVRSYTIIDIWKLSQNRSAQFDYLSFHMITHLLYCISHLTWKITEILTSCQWSCILFKNRTDIVLNDDRGCSGAGGNLRTFSLEDAM